MKLQMTSKAASVGFALAVMLAGTSAHAAQHVIFDGFSAARCFLDPEFTGAYRWQHDGIANLSSGLNWQELRVTCPIDTYASYVPGPAGSQSPIAGVLISFNDMDNALESSFDMVHGHNFYAEVELAPSGPGLALVRSAPSRLNPGTTTGEQNAWLDPSQFSLINTRFNTHYASVEIFVPANVLAPSVLHGIEVAHWSPVTP